MCKNEPVILPRWKQFALNQPRTPLGTQNYTDVHFYSPKVTEKCQHHPEMLAKYGPRFLLNTPFNE